MTFRTKRRLAVLALALGLIAAAPHPFHWIADRSSRFEFGRPPMNVFLTARTLGNSEFRSFEVGSRPFCILFASRPPRGCSLAYAIAGRISNRAISLPHESITLRVACAVALAGVWLLVVGGRLLARKWTRKDLSNAAV